MARSRYSGIRVPELWPGGHTTQIVTTMTFQPTRLLGPGHELGLCVLVTDNEAAEVTDLARCQVVSSVSDPGHVIHAVEEAAFFAVFLAKCRFYSGLFGAARARILRDTSVP